MAVSELAQEFLSQLERREAELLCWGVVDGAFSREEVEEQAEQFLDVWAEEHPKAMLPSVAELIEELLSGTLLWMLPVENERYRTRMAEGIRLMFRLRQILHWRPDWRTAPNLIADYRLLLRPRSYPKRYLAVDAVRSRVEEKSQLSPLEEDVLARVLHADSDNPFELADFQANATRRILSEVDSNRGMSGTIVCAGTGSGKTIAFYLPALIALARWSDDARRPKQPGWTRCLSLYPRNELLKDQLTTAVKRVREVNEVLRKHGRRPLTVGALFGSVPKHSSDDRALNDWSALGREDRLCPYLACPKCGQSSLVWKQADRRENVEVLRCQDEACGEVVDEDLFVIGRDAMTASPPDLLFTSLEMLNHRMSDPRLGRLFGLGPLPPRQRPRMVLLDEVHTYEGVYGAQAALLLRRWKRASCAAPHFVGLSATLADARRFFADFVDLRQSRIQDISPRDEDMEPRGQEYMLAVRGDPMSDTNLLSASIQVSMLMRRLLDPSGQEELYGSKLFAFTDNLDVINRLYHDLLDAEGWEVRGRQVRARGRRRINRQNPVEENWLATYRASNRPDQDQRFEEGQSWGLCEDINHRLTGINPPVRVGRTSSQDAGVDDAADTVIATASLEVGYDDDRVGAVLQHKAPLGAAAFLQRKGRAGRRREMRPWTIMVLSCYGRDRIAYEGYEQQFSPALKARYLPMGNRYVLRIQAVFTLLDWLSSKGVSDHVWRLLSQPPKGWRSRQGIQHLRRLVDELLTNHRTQNSFNAYLRQALRVDENVVRALMWDPPRSLMMAVLPTLSRRLAREWARAVPPGEDALHEPHAFWSPLPEFIPRALFSDLNLPEVQVEVPYASQSEAMPIRQALQEFAPGRVTLRFGVRSRRSRHWIPVQGTGLGEHISIDSFCPTEAQENLGLWSYESDTGVERIQVIRPFALAVQIPAERIGSSSNARLDWQSQLLPAEEATLADLPRASAWHAVLGELCFYTHAHTNPIEVRRFALGSTYVLKRTGEDDVEGSTRFLLTDASGKARYVAVGFSMDVDAVRVEVRPPEELFKKLPLLPERLLRGLRAPRLAYLLDGHEGLGEHSNVFQRQWLLRIILAALTLVSRREDITIEDAHQQVLDCNMQPLEEVLTVIFRTLGDDGQDNPTTRQAQLLSLIHNPQFRLAFEECTPCLWEVPNETWEPWLRRRYRATIAAALKEAAQQLCPDLDAGDLCVDIKPGLRENGTTPPEEAWLTETTVGGGGFIEALFQAYTADPRRFFGLLDAALGPTDFEDIHDELSLLLRWTQEASERGDKVREALLTVRSETRHTELIAAQKALRTTLTRFGFRVSHPVMTALQARVLRPGSSKDTDELLAGLMEDWDTLEQRLGMEVDALVFAYVRSGNDDLDRALQHLHSAPAPNAIEQWRFDTLYGLLWPRGNAIRARGLQAYNPYHYLPETDRLLVTSTLSQRREDIRLEAGYWQQRLKAALVSDGIAQLSAPLDQRPELSLALKRLMAEPIEIDFLHGVPRVRGVVQDGQRIAVVLELAEVAQ